MKKKMNNLQVIDGQLVGQQRILVNIDKSVTPIYDGAKVPVMTKEGKFETRTYVEVENKEGIVEIVAVAIAAGLLLLMIGPSVYTAVILLAIPFLLGIYNLFFTRTWKEVR